MTHCAKMEKLDLGAVRLGTQTVPIFTRSFTNNAKPFGPNGSALSSLSDLKRSMNRNVLVTSAILSGHLIQKSL